MESRQSALFLYEEAMLFAYSAALRAAAAIGVADHLAAGPRSAADLAAATGVEADTLHRILRPLAARGIAEHHGDGRWSLTGKGAALCSDAEVPACAGILMFTDPMFWTMTHELSASAADRDRTFERGFGQSLDAYFDVDEDRARLFYDGMETVSDAENPLVARSYEFPESGTVMDLGGRFGGLLMVVLRQNLGLYGVLFDRGPLVERNRLGGEDAADLAGRWEAVGGNYFVEIPPADIYLLKRGLHNWGDEDCVRLLTNCRRAMKPDGRVLVIDAIVPDGNEPHVSKAMDYLMLAVLTGRERTVAELEPLVDAADLRISRVIPTPSPMSIVECVVR